MPTDLPKRIATLAESARDAHLRIDAEKERVDAALAEVWDTLADVCRIFQAQTAFNKAVSEVVDTPFGPADFGASDIRNALADVDWPEDQLVPILGEPGWRLAPDGSKRYSARWL